MRERLRPFGGRLSIRIRAYAGTEVLAEIPLRSLFERIGENNRRSLRDEIMSRPRVLLADDHRMLIDALKGVFWSLVVEVVGEVSDGRALVEAAVHVAT